MPSLLTPTGRTRDQFVAEIANYVKMPYSASSKGELLAIAKLKNAIDKLNQRDWDFMATVEDITLSTAGNSFTLTSTAMKKPLSAILLDANSKPTQERLEWLPPREFVDAEDLSTPTVGRPEYYTMFNVSDDLKVTLDCVPNASFVAHYAKLRLRFSRLLQYPTAGSTVIDVPSYAAPFLLWEAKYQIALDEDPDKATIAKREAMDAWMQLIDDSDDYRDGLTGSEDLFL